MALATSIGSLSRPTRGILCERHIAKVKRGLQEGNNLVGSVNCLTRAGGALDGLLFYGEASDHEVARGDFGERRFGEVRILGILGSSAEPRPARPRIAAVGTSASGPFL